MIKVEGYKAFHGLMQIESKSKRVPVIEIEGDWLYKPHTNTWHCNGISYPAKFCVVVSDDSEKQTPKKGEYKYTSSYTDDSPVMVCPRCGNYHNVEAQCLYKYCFYCGQALDWSV